MSVEAVFDEAARGYDRARRMLVPGLDDFYGAVLENIPFGREKPIRVLDLGSGTGLLSAMIAERFPLSRVTLVDISVEMLRVARRRFAEKFSPGLNRLEVRVMDFARKPLPGDSAGYDLVVSALAIHHLTHHGKREQFEKIHNALANGGYFMNADQALGKSLEEEQEYQEDWLRRVREAGVTDQDIEAELVRMKADKNATLEEQTLWLEEAGFDGVDSYYQDRRFVVYGGRKGEKKEVEHG
ncbi:MAG: methyltransferase domain-containing protein [Rubrobacter sp.]|nr:methyltransferase domain-containing protein [Rubrobacter sp.]